MPHESAQGYDPGRRRGNATVWADTGGVEAANAGIRQAVINSARTAPMQAGWSRLRLLRPAALLDAVRSMAMREKHQGSNVALPKEMPFRMGYIDAAALESRTGP